jgi:hypothetical protein
LESNNKVKAVWKIVKKETGKYSTEEVTPSIKINDNAIQNPKLLADTFNTYFLIIIERMNNDTTTLTTEDAVPKTFPNINLMPKTNSVKSTKKNVGMMKTMLIKSCTDYISVPLCYLCNQ